MTIEVTRSTAAFSNVARISIAVVSAGSARPSSTAAVLPTTSPISSRLDSPATIRAPARGSTKHAATTARTYSGTKIDWGPPVVATTAVTSTASREI